MSSAHGLSKLAPLGCAISALIALSSCALPPKQAWQKIRSDGLFAYISYEMRTPRRPLDAPGPVKPIGPASKPSLTAPTRPQPLLAQQPPVNSAAKNGHRTDEGNSNVPMSPPEGTLTAIVVPGLPGYARSPYTNPPRLIDVKGSTPGGTMICPYTQKPFIVPAGALGNSPGSALADRDRDRDRDREKSHEDRKGPADSTKPRASTVASSTGQATGTEAPKNNPPALKDLASTPPAPVMPAPVAPSNPNPNPAQGQGLAGTGTGMGTAAGSKVKEAPPVNPSPSPAPATATATAPAPAAPAPEIPYGSPIVGRPGYVNSPHAAAHQLVDVTGLPVGMEVRCPYTGKLFRVPPQDVAATKPAPATTTEPGGERK